MPELNEELETLRRTNGELVAKNSTRKAKIAELEVANAALQAKLDEANGSIRRVTVDAPLRSMCESLSNDPEQFTELLHKDFNVESIEGKLALLTKDGKPVTDTDGKHVPFERDALAKFLTSGDEMRAKRFSRIVIVSRASGGGSRPIAAPRNAAASKPKLQFGLGMK